MRSPVCLPARGNKLGPFTELPNSRPRFSLGRLASGWPLALGFALLINGFLFLLLPLLTRSNPQPLDLTEPQVVSVVRLSEEDSPPLPDEPAGEPPAPEEMEARGFLEPDLVRPEMENRALPPMRFSVNPSLVLPSGLGVTGDAGLAGAGSGIIYNLEEVDQGPVPLGGSKPLYPLRAKRLGIEGVVKVKFVVDEQGNARQVRILEASPQGVFEDSVLTFLAACRFSPAKIGGRPVASEVMQPFRFELD